MNSDGYSDVVVSAPNFQNPAGRGRIFAYLGSGMGLRSFSAWTADGTNYLADSLAPAGDVNGDGFDDVIAGSDTDANNRGAIYIFQGGPRLGLRYCLCIIARPIPTRWCDCYRRAKFNCRKPSRIQGHADSP